MSQGVVEDWTGGTTVVINVRDVSFRVGAAVIGKSSILTDMLALDQPHEDDAHRSELSLDQFLPDDFRAFLRVLYAIHYHRDLPYQGMWKNDCIESTLPIAVFLDVPSLIQPMLQWIAEHPTVRLLAAYDRAAPHAELWAPHVYETVAKQMLPGHAANGRFSTRSHDCVSHQISPHPEYADFTTQTWTQLVNAVIRRFHRH